jgi:hypothetical protein
MSYVGFWHCLIFKWTNIIHMTFSVSRRLNILYIKFKLRAFYCNAAHSGKWQGWYFTLTRRTLRWPHHFPIEEQALLIFPVHLRSPSVFIRVRVPKFLTLYVCFVDHCLSVCPFSFGYCDVCPSISGFWLPLWNLHTVHIYLVWLPFHIWNQDFKRRTKNKDISILSMVKISPTLSYF